MIRRYELAKMIDYSLVKPTNTKDDVIKACKVAIKNNVGTLCVLPPFVSLAAEALSRSDTRVCAAAAFPFGAHPTEIKVEEVKYVVSKGADEVDFVANIPLIKSGEYESVRRDIEEVVEHAKRDRDTIVKVIIETSYLTPEEIISVSKIVDEAGADYVKTCTGFGPRGATLEDVKLIKQAVRKAKIKAAGGISTFEKAVAFIDAGASRIGASRITDILRGCSSL